MNRRKKRTKETAVIVVLYLILMIALLMLTFVGAEAKETGPTITSICTKVPCDYETHCLFHEHSDKCRKYEART